MEKLKILLVEDEENLLKTIQLNLELENYLVTSAETGIEALKEFRKGVFDLVILDVMLLEMSGFDVCEAIRLENKKVPILFLTAKDTSEDKIKGLKLGADDYLTKPFNLEELLLRVEKLIKKNEVLSTKGNISDTYTFGKNSIDFNGLIGKNKKGEKIELTKKEAMLLKLLIDNKNEVVTREKILQSVWGYNVFPTTRTIDNFILNFRKYFEEDSRNPVYFHSVRGIGYKFTSD
mgnify:CR=1 FL=1